MEICNDCYEYGEMLDSAALMQGLRRLQERNYCLTLPPRPCPAGKPVGNNFKTIIKARLLSVVSRQWSVFSKTKRRWSR